MPADFDGLARYISIEFEFSSDTVKVGNDLAFCVKWKNHSNEDVEIYPNAKLSFSPAAPDDEVYFISFPGGYYTFNNTPDYSQKVTLSPLEEYTECFTVPRKKIGTDLPLGTLYYKLTYNIPLSDTQFTLRGGVTSSIRKLVVIE